MAKTGEDVLLNPATLTGERFIRNRLVTFWLHGKDGTRRHVGHGQQAQGVAWKVFELQTLPL